MGSCFSQEKEKEKEARPKLTPAQISQNINVVIPSVTWEVDERWAKHSEDFRQMHINGGYDIDAGEAFRSTMFMRATEYLNKIYPDCARAGIAEDMGESAFATSYGRCRYPTKTILTLDDNFTGVLYAYSTIIAAPGAEGDQKKWPLPGAWLDSPDIEGAKQAALKMMAITEQSGGAITTHVVLWVFIGGDLVTCRYNAANTLPTITKLDRKPSKAFKKSNKEMRSLARSKPDQFRGLLRPMIFRAVLDDLTKDYPGCTVWDEGEMQFKVGDKVYPHATRLLIARRFEDMATDVGAVHFKLMTPMDEDEDFNLRILRNSNPAKDPGGIIAVCLLISIAEGEAWPLVGTYAKKPAMLEAVDALTELVQKWNREGRLQRCLFQVHMGADIISKKLVGEKFDSSATSECQSSVKEFGDLPAAFHIKLEQQKKHELFESESEFRAVKQRLGESRAKHPERFERGNSMAPDELPNCEVSDEGEFSTIIDDKIVPLAGTRHVVAKVKGKDKHNVIAVLNVVFSPNGLGWAATEKNWLDTKEMKAADDALLELLKKWYLEEKIAEDCMAQVKMGMDVTIYRFVDGERFEDYSDERMAQIWWG